MPNKTGHTAGTLDRSRTTALCAKNAKMDILVPQNFISWAFTEGSELQLLHECATKPGEPEGDLIERIAAGRLEGLEAACNEAMQDERRRMA